MAIRDRIRSAWNVFVQNSEQPFLVEERSRSMGGYSSTRRPVGYNSRTIVGSIYTKLAIDVAGVAFQHVKLDADGRFVEVVKSSLQECLILDPNIDQGARAFRQDIALTMFEEGHAAIVPVDTTANPFFTGAYDIQSMRVGIVREFMPRAVRVELYNDRTGLRQDVILPKSAVAIVENPLYKVMNEPNSTLQRLLRKLTILDAIDEQSGSGKLDIIIQLPYVVKSETRRQQAEQRRRDLELQLTDSKYGIGYVDGTERITQLNRPAENNLMAQVEYLTNMLYSELGLTPAVVDGSADEAQMKSYKARSVYPIVQAIQEAMAKTFLTKTARAQGHSIEYYVDPFLHATVADIAELGEKFTRNEIASSNEIRAALGMRSRPEAQANELRNKNMPTDKQTPQERAEPPELNDDVKEE